MKEIKAIIQPFMKEKVLAALRKVDGLPGITVSDVIGIGKPPARDGSMEDSKTGYPLVGKVKLELVVTDELMPEVVGTIAAAAHTGNLGDGKIFVSPVLETVQIRTGAQGDQAI